MIEKTEIGEGRAGLLSEVLSKLKSGGFSVAEFNEKRHLRVAPGVTLEVFMAELVNALEVRLDGDKIVYDRVLIGAQKAYVIARAKARNEANLAMRVLNLQVPHYSHQ